MAADSGGVTVNVVNEESVWGQPSTPPSVMDSLWDTLNHLDRIERKLDRLREARNQSLAAAAAACARTDLGRLEARQVVEWFRDRGHSGVQSLLSETEWPLARLDNRRRCKWPPSGFPYVYMLRDGPRVVYVGRTISNSGVQSRVRYHKKNGKVFDAVDIWVCEDEEEMLSFEADLIAHHFDGLENKRHEPGRAAF